jgi:hypothetical protein
VRVCGRSRALIGRRRETSLGEDPLLASEVCIECAPVIRAIVGYNPGARAPARPGGNDERSHVYEFFGIDADRQRLCCALIWAFILRRRRASCEQRRQRKAGLRRPCWRQPTIDRTPATSGLERGGRPPLATLSVLMHMTHSRSLAA